MTTIENPMGTQPIKKLLMQLAVPAMIANVVNALYNIVDQIFIGQGVGYLGNAATNIAFPITTICLALGLMTGVGAASNFNLELGRKEVEKARRIAGTAVVQLIVMGIAVCVIVQIFLAPLMQLFGATDQIFDYAMEYSRITAYGIPFFLFSTGFNPLVRSDGRATFSMMAIIAGAVLNTVLDPIFIFVFQMGIAGAAWATVISQMVSALLLFAYIPKFRSVKFQWEDFIPHMKQVEAIAALGLTSFIFQISALIVQIVSNNLLKTYGAMSIYGSEIPIAVGGIVSKVFVIFIALIIGMTQGVQPIVGYNYGAKYYERVRQTIFLALKIGFGLSFVTWAVFEIFPLQIIQLFGNGNDLYFEFGIRYMRYFMLFTLINGITILITTFFPAIGKAKTGAFLSLARQLLILLPVMLLMTYTFGVEGMMFATPVSDVISLVLCLFFFKRELHDIHMKEELILSK
ncbi:MATE family efflux transporter [Granulicatella elegans]|uniref:Multidrug export protein MepA n=1 Tax=Granulicatella elegans ATCC 700633 TaxID=626369 RepID=D0BJE3_9LACT|nr:MATE family efflux transporter [Granulicatella elegans]EEW93196.1 MATE efflux family protein [Granulicatella elegans ATCC 700633]